MTFNKADFRRSKDSLRKVKQFNLSLMQKIVKRWTEVLF